MSSEPKKFTFVPFQPPEWLSQGSSRPPRRIGTPPSVANKKQVKRVNSESNVTALQTGDLLDQVDGMATVEPSKTPVSRTSSPRTVVVQRLEVDTKVTSPKRSSPYRTKSSPTLAQMRQIPSPILISPQIQRTDTPGMSPVVRLVEGLGLIDSRGSPVLSNTPTDEFPMKRKGSAQFSQFSPHALPNHAELSPVIQVAPSTPDVKRPKSNRSHRSTPDPEEKPRKSRAPSHLSDSLSAGNSVSPDFQPQGLQAMTLAQLDPNLLLSILKPGEKDTSPSLTSASYQSGTTAHHEEDAGESDIATLSPSLVNDQFKHTVDQIHAPHLSDEWLVNALDWTKPVEKEEDLDINIYLNLE